MWIAIIQILWVAARFARLGWLFLGDCVLVFDSVELVSFLGWVSLHGLAISVGGGMVGGVVVWVLLEFWVCLVSLSSCGVGII